MKTRSLFALLLAAVMVVSLVGCGGTPSTSSTPSASQPASTPASSTASSQPAAETGPETVVVAMTNAWDTMMPMNTASNYNRLIYSQVYSKLTAATGSGTYEPDLAASWEANEASDTVTFHLNKDITWHDGEKFTAEDVVFSLQLYSDPKVEAIGRYSLANIAGTDDSGAELSEDSIAVEAPDENTVVITLKSAMFYETLLNDLNDTYIVAKHIFDGLTPEQLNSSDPWAKPVGTGPFTYESEISGERMEFAVNDKYFKGTPDIEKLVVRVVPTTNLLSGLMSGDIDILAGGGMGSVLLDDWAMAQSQDNLVASSTETAGYQVLITNSQKDYMTKEVRQAFSMAINRSALVDSLLQGEGVAIVTPISPMSPYYNDKVEIWYDVEGAKKILEDNNFPFDQELIFYVPTGNVTRERAAALIEQNLEQLGVKVTIKSVDFTTLMNDMRDGKHDFGIIGSGGTLDPSESVQMIDPESSYNFSLNKDMKFVELCEKGNAELTFETRYPYFAEYQELVKDESKMIYLFTTNSLMAYNERLSNVKVEDFAALNWNIFEWVVD